jgi:hypothetical protein
VQEKSAGNSLKQISFSMWDERRRPTFPPCFPETITAKRRINWGSSTFYLNLRLKLFMIASSLYFKRAARSSLFWKVAP